MSFFRTTNIFGKEIWDRHIFFYSNSGVLKISSALNQIANCLLNLDLTKTFFNKNSLDPTFFDFGLSYSVDQMIFYPKMFLCQTKISRQKTLNLNLLELKLSFDTNLFDHEFVLPFFGSNSNNNNNRILNECHINFY